MLVFKKIGKIFLLLLLFIIVFVLAFPKERLYYGMLQELDKHKVQVVSQNMESGMAGFELDKTTLYLSSAPIAKISSLSMDLFGAKLENIMLQGSFQSMLPKIDTVDISFLSTTFCTIQGEFGSIVGTFDIATQKIIFKANIDQNTYNKYRQVFGQFQPRDGGYIYEYTL